VDFDLASPGAWWYPWFWSSSGFASDGVNDMHLTVEQKRKP
jgi:hypothetical protein